MRSLYFLAPGELEWRDAPAPVIERDTDALVSPIVATTCDIDPLILTGGAPIPGPFPIGHEAIGEIIEVGAKVRGFRPGDRVVMSYYDACGRCARCGHGLLNRCHEFSPDLAHRSWHGVGLTGVGYFSERVRVPAADHTLHHFPLEFDPTHLASLGDNIGFGWEYVVPHLQKRPGADVLIMGGVNSISLYAAAFARVAGAGRVVFIDQCRERLAIAEKFGAEVIEGPAPKVAGSFPITVDASADEASLLCAIRSTEMEGQCSSVGGHFRPVALPVFEMYAKGIHFYTGPGRGVADVAPAIDLIRSSRLDLSPVTSAIHPMTDAASVLRSPGRKPVFVV